MKKVVAFALVLLGLVLLRWLNHREVAAAPRPMPVEKSAVGTTKNLPRATADEPRHKVTPLPQAEPDEDALVPAYRGTVVDRADGQPIEGASVKLCRALGHDVLCEDELASAETDEKGRFRIVWPPQDSDEENGDNGDNAASGDKGAPVEPKLLLVEAEEHATALVGGAELPRARHGDGVVVRLGANACIVGKLRDRDGQLIDGGTVDWYLAQGAPGEGTSSSSNEDGSFAITGVPAAEVVVIARHEDEEGQMHTGEARVDLRDGGPHHLDLVLRPVPKRTLAGRVTDRLGHPLALAGVTVEPAAGNASAEDRAMLAEHTYETNLAGEFEVPVATTGPFLVKVYALHPGLDELLAEAEVSAVGGPASIVVWEAGNARCRLLDAAGRTQPLSSLRVLYKSPRANGVIGSAAAARPVDEAYFVWPRGVQSMNVVMYRSRPGRVARPTLLILNRPDEACVATLSPDT